MTLPVPDCHHCGEPCYTDIPHDGNHFCCSGCRTVYALLNDLNMGTYYQLQDEAAPGIRPGSNRPFNFDLLKDAATARRLYEFHDADLARITLQIPGMHCSSCIWLLERLTLLNAGVVRARVHFPRKEVTITFHPSMISLYDLVSLLVSIGYEPLIRLDSSTDRQPVPGRKRLLYQLGLSGFAFGNVMLYTFPEYLPGGDLIHPQMRYGLGLLSLILAVPVLLFGSIDFFRSALTGLRQRWLNIDVPISLGIIALFSRSAYEVLVGHGFGYLDSFTGLVFFLLIGKYVQQRSYAALAFDRGYQSYFPITVTRLRSNLEEHVGLDEIEAGDRVRLRNMELVPADGVLISDGALLDYSFITGESEPVKKVAGELLFAGARLLGKSVDMGITKIPEESFLPRLWSHQVFSDADGSTLGRKVDLVSRYFTAAVLIIALGTGLYWMTIGWSQAVLAVTAVLIVACPCALALATPFALGTVQSMLGKRGLFLRSSQIAEIMAQTDTIVFDKTGTLTQNMNERIQFQGRRKELSQEDLLVSKVLAAQSAHPLSRYLHANIQVDGDLAVEDYLEEPGRGIAGLVSNRAVRLGSLEWIGAPADASELVSADFESSVHLSLDGEYRGVFQVRKRFRPGLKEMIPALQNRFSLHVISGDNAADNEVLRELFGPDAQIHFQQSPMEKLEYVEALRESGRRVLVIGDGLNDAGALRAGDAGLAVAGDVFAFTPSSDGILKADQLHQLGSFIQFCRSGLIAVYASFAVSIIYNIVGVGFAVAGLLTPLVSAILMPASSITIVAISTLGTRWAGRRLGFDTV